MSNTPGNYERGYGDDSRGYQRIGGNETRQASGATKSSQDVGNGSLPGERESVDMRPRSNRGFASMDQGKQKEIASKGGKAAHAKGTAHEFDSGEARTAGRKGGLAVSQNREHMAQIGRRGGEARGATRSSASNTNGSQNNSNSSDTE